MSETYILDLFQTLTTTETGLHALTQRGIVLNMTSASQLIGDVNELTVNGTEPLSDPAIQELITRIPPASLAKLAKIITAPGGPAHTIAGAHIHAALHQKQ